MSYGLVIYGATPAGCAAAAAAMRGGATVCVIEPTPWIGGTWAGGLSVVDLADATKLGGLGAAFMAGVTAYTTSPKYRWQPHTALSILTGWLSGATVYVGRTLSGASLASGRIQSVTLDNGTVVEGSQFVDASYEGDLMACSGTAYTSGRESKAQYGEAHAGYGVATLDYGFSAYVSGTSGPLIYGVRANDNETKYQGDQKYMAPGWRVELTTRADRLPFPMPSGYDPAHYVGALRSIQQNGLTSHAGLWASSKVPSGAGYSNYCTDNATGSFTTDWSGMEGSGWDYANGNWSSRQAILADSKARTMGFFYFLANDPSVPATVQADVNTYGLPPDEFTDNGGWPTQMYIREGRRMIGQYVMTEADVTTAITKADSIGLGQWPLDCHVCQRYCAANGNVTNEGMITGHVYYPYQVPFRAMLSNQVSNLAVAVCSSCSHVAWMANRVETLYVVQGEAAGTAAALALTAGVDVAQVDVGLLQTALTANGAILS